MQQVRHWLRIMLLLALALLWAAGASWLVEQAAKSSWALWLEHWTGDFRTALLSHRPKRQHGGIAIVAINDDTMQPYPYRSPVDRRLLARLITTLEQAGAKAIGLDFLFLKSTEPEKDEELIAAITEAAKRIRIVIAAGDRRVDLSEAQTKYQAEFLERSGATGGYANLLTGGDRIVRYVALPDDPAYPKSFAVALAKPDAKPPENGPRRIAWLLSPHDGNERFFSIPAHLLITPQGNSTPVAPALLQSFKDKIVIIGGDFPDADRHQVPMKTWLGEDDEIAGMVIHAQVAAQLLDGRLIEHVNRPWLLGLFGALALLGVWFGLRHGLVAITIYSSAASIFVVGADMIAFYFLDRIVPFGACLGALAIGVIGGVILRRVQVMFAL